MYIFRPTYHRCYLIRFVSTKSDVYRRCYEILNVSPDADQETVRAAYIEIVKKFHPDSGHEAASAHRFHEVDNAFRILLAKYAKERRNIFDDDVEVTNDAGGNKEEPLHAVPQHRQYLSFDGVGYGNPSQREKQYQQIKVMQAHRNIMEYRVEKANAESSENELVKNGTFYKKHGIKTKYGFDRVVEDLIQTAMSKGDFDNLSGSGKPLSHVQTQNPYINFTEHKINKILIDNGFTPQWIMIQKDIRNSINDLEESLKNNRAYLGNIPLSEEEQTEWTQILDNHKYKIIEINKMIDKYNMITPTLRHQLIHIDLDRAGAKILKIDPKTIERKITTNSVNSNKNNNNNNSRGFLSFLSSWL